MDANTTLTPPCSPLSRARVSVLRYFGTNSAVGWGQALVFFSACRLRTLTMAMFSSVHPSTSELSQHTLAMVQQIRLGQEPGVVIRGIVWHSSTCLQLQVPEGLTHVAPAPFPRVPPSPRPGQAEPADSVVRTRNLSLSAGPHGVRAGPGRQAGGDAVPAAGRVPGPAILPHRSSLASGS